VTDVVFLWHMHQPRYVDPATGRPALPWVRLHAASGYLDMARALERHPGARVTVNFVPSLVEQLEALDAGAKDPLELLAEKPETALEPRERQAIVDRCFSAHWGRCIATRPRYLELARRREDGPRAFGPAELRDLQCLFLLAWLGPAARADAPEIDALEAIGKGYTERDKQALLRAVRRAAGQVLPAWRALAQRGQIELCASPFHHPIVPLLCDTDAARVARPGDQLPARTSWPEDARAQVDRGLAAHTRVFGAPPAGMWPPEGSVSPAAVAIYQAAGVRWLVTDEGVLHRSLDAAPDEARGLGGRPARSFPWRVGQVTMLFRDRELSDRIGFRYHDQPAAQAADDLVGSARARSGGGLAVIALDGENAWEAFPGRGAPFLDALYERLGRGRDLRCRTVSEAVAERAGEARTLSRLHAGSWIDADFHIWIGEPVKNKAWRLLAETRARWAGAHASRGDDQGVRMAHEHLLAAQASDWFWWFGAPFSSAEDPLFDALFRAQLAAVYRALGQQPPAVLEEPVDDSIPTDRSILRPSALISPRLDGRMGYYEWRGAARHELQSGAMADGSRPLEAVLVGFDLDRLYLCLEPGREDRRRVGAARLHLDLAGPHRTLQVVAQLGAPDGGPAFRDLGGQVASGEVIELALPFATLGLGPRDRLRLAGRIEFGDIDIARWPAGGTLEIQVPHAGFADDDWRV
jgi:alpha-amylase/alpha-mannosidase (GH57 family)